MLAQDSTLKLKVDFITNLKTKEAINQVDKAVQQGLVDSVVAITNDAIKLCRVKTGHNRRSIAYKVGNKVKRKGQPKGDEKPFIEWQPDTGKLEGAIYSTSGYGGYLETGTVRMDPRPYLKPALDMNKGKLPQNIKGHLG